MESKLVWSPSEKVINNARMRAYMDWLRTERDLNFNNYQDLWKWSVDSYTDFWKSIWDYFDVQFDGKISEVTNGDGMPHTRWFEGTLLNYAEHIFRNKSEHPALIAKSETRALTELSWAELREQVSSFQAYLKSCGVGKGDRVVAFVSNIPEATVAFLATIGLGAIWSSCSPDFGTKSVVDRFEQIKPKVLVAVNGYSYNGKPYAKLGVVNEIHQSIESIERVVIIPFIEHIESHEYDQWSTVLSSHEGDLIMERVPFNHPIWVLFSSGTTGNPKAITHSHGGVLLEHLKYLAFHNDVHPGEKFFWFSTTGWMMWNFVNASLLVGATMVLYDGSAGYPDLNAMWSLIDEAGIHHFGTSAPYIVACMNKALHPGKQYSLETLRSIGSTGSPLPPEGFDWVYQHVKADVWLTSMSGGTDVCTAFVGGNPLWPVYMGEIQCRTLGCALYAYDDAGEPVEGELGEMVITKPMPSMPIYFWGDEGQKRYLASYFEMYPGIWRHGDWIKITDHNGLIIYGRSDATLNRQGVRIGTSEIYRALRQVDGIEDGLIVNLELSGGRHFMPLFVMMEAGIPLDEEKKREIKTTLRKTYSPRHVPDVIVEAPAIPYTISGKKMEAPIKKILLGLDKNRAINLGAMKNPECVGFYEDYALNDMPAR